MAKTLDTDKSIVIMGKEGSEEGNYE